MYQQPSYSVRGLYALLFSAVLLSLASCGGGGGGGGGAAKSTATAVSAGAFHTCAVVENGAVQCWGYNENGQLGNGSTNDSHVPVQVSELSGVTAISAGAFHTCAILSTGAAMCWGINSNGQLGVDKDSTASSSTPVQVTDLGSGVIAIAAGSSHTCAIHNTAGEDEAEELAAKCWGHNGNGQLGNTMNVDSSTPVQVTGLLEGVTAIAAGFGRSCAVVAGAAKCWGDNGNRELGDGSDTNRNEPVDVTSLGSGVMDIATGDTHTCAILSTGAAKCWGDGVNGKLGTGNRAIGVPADGTVMNLDSGVTAIAAGSSHTCAIHNGAAKCWGKNTAGSLGDGSNTARLLAVDVMDLSSGVTAVTAGGGQTCAVHNGAAKCWGNNRYGKLGNNTETVYETSVSFVTTLQGPDNNRNTPTTVTGF